MQNLIFPSKKFWTFNGNEQEKSSLGSLASTLTCQGELISKDPISSVLRCNIANRHYYIKTYRRNGKGVRNYIGRGRPQGEWENLIYFDKLGIPTPRLVAYGQNYQRLRLRHAVLITEEVAYSQDLATLVKEQPQSFKQRDWRQEIIHQVADYTARLHRNGFIHWDLKWRNILVQQRDENNQEIKPRVLFFDCPLGRRRFGWLRRRGAMKDLACLDKIGKNMLSRTDRLRFFLSYRGHKRITATDKKMIGKIASFFS